MHRGQNVKQRRYLYIFAALVAIYASIAFATPIDPDVLAKYDISNLTARLLNATVIIPIVAIWSLAFYGFSKLRSYALAVKDSTEGPHLQTLSTGLMLLVFSLPLSAALSAGLTYFTRNHDSFLPTTTILRNYVSVLCALAAFYLIGRGAEGLARLVKPKGSPLLNQQRWTTGLIIVSCIATWFVVSRHAASGHDSVYYLPGWLVVLTIVIPYMYVWYRGLVAAYSIYFYQTKVRGTLYKHALGYFSAGLAFVIGASVLIQLFTTLSEQINRLNLTPILIMLYLLVLIYGAGYALIAKGAKKLKSIEDA